MASFSTTMVIEIIQEAHITKGVNFNGSLFRCSSASNTKL